MSNEVEVRDSAKVLPFPDSRPVEKRRLIEKMIERRMQRLGNLIKGLIDAPYPGLLSDREDIREALEELVVKETTLRWIVRIAKGTEGAVRERLWSDIIKAVADLEAVADSVRHAKSAR